MKRFLAPCLLILALASSPSFANAKGKKNPGGGAGPDYKIVQADPSSITVSLGKTGEEHETFAIDAKTKIIVDGAPATPSDLKAGMKAHVKTGADHQTATEIRAGDPPAKPGWNRAG